MKNYSTFFFCTRDWGGVEETIFPVIEKLLSLLPLSRKVQASAQLKSGGKPRIISGSYQKIQKDLDPRSLIQLILQVPGQTPGVQEFFLFFENVRYEPTPEYLRFVFPRVPERIETSGDLKICSFSVSYDLFRQGLIGTQLEMIERLFVATNGVYGFGNPTMWPISGPFQFVRDNSPQAGRRIVDFNYVRQIEDVYLYNYLSESHLREMAELDELCATRGVECKRLHDEDQRPHGLAVYVENDPNTVAVARGYLRNLIPASEASSKSFQLLLPGTLDNALENRLNKYSFAAAVIDLHDFIRIALRAPVSVHDNQEFYTELNEFFADLRPGAVRRAEGIAQLLVQYPGFFEPDQIVQRIPYILERSPKRDEHVKVYFTANAKRERLKVLFLMSANTDSAELDGLVREWLASIERHPDVYGSVKTIEELSPRSIENQTHAQMLIDATHLTADGFNLLVLLLDRINYADLIVRYLVCGDLPQSF